MIRLVEALNYRCLRYVSRKLDDFHVLVGPNASGKTTFLDVIAFLGKLVSDGPEAALEERAENFLDLIWLREGTGFELAVEAAIPDERRKKLADASYDTVRYEVQIGIDPEKGSVGILAEQVLLKRSEPRSPVQRTLFPMSLTPPDTLMSPKRSKKMKRIVNKTEGGSDYFHDETGTKWNHQFKLGPRRSALGNLPEDESKFPVSTWLKQVLTDGVQSLALNSAFMRKPSPPGGRSGFRPDGSRLPWAVESLAKTAPDRFSDWIAHLRTALPDVETIRTVERPEDRHRYLVVRYANGLEAASWMVSDGTLRLLALTLIAYLTDLSGIYLIEEPENGIHPQAVETVFQSLSSVYDAQILVTTHSPVILSVAEQSQVLCFAKTPDGATDVIAGDEHPALSDWRGETNLGVLFAGGVLG